ncbi:hypothetical protein ABIB40_003494 [Pedobacter sp. UYP30]|uniref:DUF7935 family protein n=1 Tax=Pedobacter sp. UYP30 TaxID=1756400 RepID=UPI003394A6E3
MIVPSFLIEMITLFLGVFLALLAIYGLVRKDIVRFLSLKNVEMHQETRAHILPLRLQAHERLILFIDRINPANMLLRLHQPGISIAELQAAVLTEIRSEYQHNIAQQLYVGASTWQVVKKLKDDTIGMVNNGAQGFGKEATGLELAKAILEHMAGIEENPYDLTISLIKQDIHQLF